MSIKNFNIRIQNKVDTEANWKDSTFVPLKGEAIIYDVDSTHSAPRLKIGDGQLTADALPFVTNAESDTPDTPDTPTVVQLPVLKNPDLTYNGEQQTAIYEYDSSKCFMLAMSTTSATDAGTYEVWFGLSQTNSNNPVWVDGTTGTKKFTWTIKKAVPVLSVSPSTLTLSDPEEYSSFSVSYTGSGGTLSVSGFNTEELDVWVDYEEYPDPDVYVANYVAVPHTTGLSGNLTITFNGGTNYESKTIQYPFTQESRYPISLDECSWDTVAELAELDMMYNYYSVGDYMLLYNTENIANLGQGSPSVLGAVFIHQENMKAYFMGFLDFNNDSSYTIYDALTWGDEYSPYEQSYIAGNYCPEMYEKLKSCGVPAELMCNVVSNGIIEGENPEGVYVTIPSYYNIYGSNPPSPYNHEGEYVQFDYFADANIKNRKPFRYYWDSDYPQYSEYWLKDYYISTMEDNGVNEVSVLYIDRDGSQYSTLSTEGKGVVPIFAIGYYG